MDVSLVGILDKVDATSQGVAVLASIMVVSCLLPLPRLVLNIGAGAIFGFKAIPIIALSLTAGAIIAFVLSRYFARGMVRRFFANKPSIEKLMYAIDREGWRVMAILRFCSPVPGVAQNYVYGLTNVTVISFVLTTLIFPIPVTSLYVMLGYVGRGIFDPSFSIFGFGIALLGFLSLATAIVLIARRMQLTLSL